MKIYTKTGDRGETSLIGGQRVPKYHLRLEAYGTIDELIAFTGLLRDFSTDSNTNTTLLEIQDKLMICAAILASDCDDCEIKIPKIKKDDILFLEKEIDAMESNLPQLSSFILPGGHPLISYTHVARTVCRRAERLIIKLSEETKVPNEVIMYVNRLSDYYFVLSRKFSVDLKVIEHLWLPKL